MKLVGLLIVLNFAIVNSIILDCIFHDEIINSWGVRYTCKVKEFNNRNNDKFIIAVNGKHVNQNSIENVTQFNAKGISIGEANN